MPIMEINFHYVNHSEMFFPNIPERHKVPQIQESN